MSILKNKIDFAVVLSVKNANPNGDPLNGNRPREDNDGFGEISDVCIKRKIRNRLIDMGENIFVQSDDKNVDGFKSLKDRADSVDEVKKLLKNKSSDKDEIIKLVCSTWTDVRSFGQVFAFKGDSVSVGVRGPVSVHSAFSVAPVDVSSMQITKSVNSVTGDKKSSDTMGMKHTVNYGVYTFYGSINCQLAEKTGFTEEDAEKIRQTLVTLFENDSSSARPDGSMEVLKVYWWKHNCPSGQYSSAKVHRLLKIDTKKAQEDMTQDIDNYISLDSLPNLEVTVYDGI